MAEMLSNSPITAIPHEVFSLLNTSVRELRCTPIIGKGEANEVYLLERGSKGFVEGFIVRLHKGEEHVSMYQKEKWCIEQTARIGVPNAQCVEIGTGGGKAFMIQTALPAVDARDWSGDPLVVWRALGAHAAKINSVSTRGFGWELHDPTTGDFGGTWSALTDWCLEDLFGNSFFEEQGILTERQVRTAQARLEEMYGWAVEPRLSHGNLAPKNAMVGADETVFVIDWGTAASSRAPHQDLSDIITWDYDPRVVAAFREGYGISDDEFEGMRRDLDTLVLQRILDSIKWAAARRADWREVDFVRHSVSKLAEFV